VKEVLGWIVATAIALLSGVMWLRGQRRAATKATARAVRETAKLQDEKTEAQALEQQTAAEVRAVQEAKHDASQLTLDQYVNSRINRKGP
jgi:uncharacterized protein YlxW (UPF0749 family)